MNTLTDSTIFNLKTKKQVKALAQLRAEQLGIPLGTIVNAFLRNFGQTGEVHFVPSKPVTPKMTKILASIEDEITKGDTYGPFKADEAVNFLKKNTPSSLGIDSDGN